MAEAAEKSRPISFRVDTEILDALAAAGLSPVDISRAALAREARRARQMAALERLTKNPSKLKFDFDATEFIRKDRDAR